MVEMCIVEVKSYIMYDFYYAQVMLYVGLINSLPAKTSFMSGQTFVCITY